MVIEILSMRRYIIPFLISGTLLLPSCSKDEMPADADPSLNTGKVKMEFKAGIEPVSRTELIDGTEQNLVNWEENDTISLFDPNSNNIFITSEGGESVTFTGSAQDGQTTYYALYPYDDKATISGGEIETTLPAEQSARVGSFAKMLNPSVAKSGIDKVLTFKNVCSVVKFTLESSVENKITKVMFSGNNGEALAGTLRIDVSSEIPVATVQAQSAKTEVILNGDFVSNSTYYFVTAPANLSKGLTLTFYDENGKEWKRVGTKSSELRAGQILNLGTIKPDEFRKVMYVSSAEDLVDWAESIDNLTTDIVLESDIDMSDKTWIPVGSSISTGYSGNFDGNGKYIRNLNVSVQNGNAGLFGGLAKGAKVYNVKFTGAQIKGPSSVGVIAGESLGIIEGCDVSESEVTGYDAGAIVGKNSVQVNNCNVQNVLIKGYNAGGVSGTNYGKIENCIVNGSTTIESTGLSAGGIVGSNDKEGNVKTSGRVLKCTVDNVTVIGKRAGGTVGENTFGTVVQCIVNSCNVIHNISTNNETNLGGVVGYNARGEIVASYSVDTTVGANDLTSSAIGGIVGYNMDSTSSPVYVYGCYSKNVSLLGSAGKNQGAIAGYNNGSVISCYAYGVSGVGLVGTGGTKYCVEVGSNDYNILITNVPDLLDNYGTTWKAVNIWNMTGGDAPTIYADYLGETDPSI